MASDVLGRRTRIRDATQRKLGKLMQFVFGDCVLDLERRELTRHAEAVPMGPQVFDLLLYLVQNRARVVSKDDVLDAVWKGRIVSESTLTSHINAVRKAVGDNGEKQSLLRTIPRIGFRFVGDVREIQQSAPSDSIRSSFVNPGDAPASAPPLPDKPSLAVLPFLNLSGDVEQDYFADGIVEDIIAALSHIGWLFVIARNSSFTYKGRAVGVKQIGRELGVRYVLEGSLRKAASRVRITAQLVDAASGINIWADRFEGHLEDIFRLQDDMAQSVVGAIAPQLERAEIDRAMRKPTESLDAYDYYLRGMAHFHRSTRESIAQALSLFEKAIALDHDFSSAYGMAASCIYWRKMNAWLIDRTSEMAKGAELAAKALALGRDDAVALMRGGHALPHFGGDLDRGIAHVDRALTLNPNFATAWYLSAFQRVSSGSHDDAVERFAHAMRLSPLDPELFQMQTGTAMAHMFARRFDEASVWVDKASKELPGILRVAAFSASSHALAGRREKARDAIRHVRNLDPNLRISNLKDWVVLRRAEDLDTFSEGMRKAGLPA